MAKNGATDFERAKKYCDSFVDSVTLGTKLLDLTAGNIPQFKLVSMGLVKASKVAALGCKAFPIALKVRSYYFSVKNFLAKFGLKIPGGNTLGKNHKYREEIKPAKDCPAPGGAGGSAETAGREIG